MAWWPPAKFIEDEEVARDVGRVILAFGWIDQQVCGDVTRYRWIKDGVGLGREEGRPDNRFTHRMKHIRRLIRELTGDDEQILARFDALQTAWKRFERIRGTLAHGHVGQGIGHYVVYEQRALADLAEAGTQADCIRLSKREVKALPDEMLESWHEANRIRDLVAHKCGAQDLPRPRES